MRKHWMLYVMILPGILFYIIFKYIPLGGSIIAFQNFQIMRGIWSSPWVGLDNFKFIFTYQDFYLVLRNTALIALYKLVLGFPAPILLALLFNEVRKMLAKRALQSIFYLPHFLSWVVVGELSLKYSHQADSSTLFAAGSALSRYCICSRSSISAQLSSYPPYGKK